MKYDFITIGDCFEDVFVLPSEAKIKRDPSFASGMGLSFELGDKIPLEDVDYEIGGSACNVAVGLSRLGIKTSIVSLIGNDSPAEKIKSCLVREKIDQSSLISDRTTRSNFSIIFRTDSGRTIFVYHCLDYTKLRIKKNIAAKWIFLAPTGEGAEELEKDIIAKISEENAMLAWNPGALQIKKGVTQYRHLLKNTSVLFLNKEEAGEFLRSPAKPSTIDVLRRFHYYGVKITVVTNGREGAVAYDGKRLYKIGVLEKVRRVDSTGAGDSSNTGFLAKLFLSGWDPRDDKPEVIAEALKWGIVDSNSVITFIGAQKGLLHKAAIEKGVEQNPQLKVEVEEI